MSKRPAKPEPMSWVIPYLIVEDAGEAADFYHDVFGLEILSKAKNDSGKTIHAEMKYKDIVIMCGCPDGSNDSMKTPAQCGYRSPVGLYLYCEDVDAHYKKVKQKGANVQGEPKDQFYGDRNYLVIDPDGHHWTFGTNVADHQ